MVETNTAYEVTSNGESVTLRPLTPLKTNRKEPIVRVHAKDTQCAIAPPQHHKFPSPLSPTGRSNGKEKAMGWIKVLLLGIVLTQLIYFLLAGSRIRRHGKRLRKAPDGLPFLGHGIHFLKPQHQLFEWYAKCQRLFGLETFEVSVPVLPGGVVINDPKNLEFVLKNEAVFAKGDFFKKRSWDLFGNGIINADGDLWRVQRKAGLHFLNTSNFKVLTDDVLPHLIKNTVTALKGENSSEVIDLERVFHELTTQLMGRMAYDMDMHAADDFSLAFEYAAGVTGERFQNPLWEFTEPFLAPQLKNSLAAVKTFGRNIVANARKGHKHSEGEVSENKEEGAETAGSLINALLASIPDERMVADAALNYLSAGRDTTSQSLTWTFYLLMRNPRVMSSIRAAIQPDGGNSTGEELICTQLPPAATVYIMAVFYEALRLHPPVPFELKECQTDTTLPDGTFLPKGSIVMWCLWAMNRSKNIWGADSTVFRPERWIDHEKLIPKTASEFPVFNGGPRTCLGKKMAESVAVMVIAELAMKFDFKPKDDRERVSKSSLTLPMDGGLPCYVQSRIS